MCPVYILGNIINGILRVWRNFIYRPIEILIYFGKGWEHRNKIIFLQEIPLGMFPTTFESNGNHKAAGKRAMPQINFTINENKFKLILKFKISTTAFYTPQCPIAHNSSSKSLLFRQ